MGERPRRTGPAGNRRSARRGAPTRQHGSERPSGRSVGRPAQSRPAEAARPLTDRSAVGASTAWARGVGLVFILVMLAVTLVPTMRSYLRQQAEIAALSEQVTAQSRTIEGLKADQARWSDPAYVEQQARERLKFVKVGDRAYTVIDPGATDPAVRAEAPVVDVASVSATGPWYGQLWQSVQVADRPSAGMKAKAPAGQGP